MPAIFSRKSRSQASLDGIESPAATDAYRHGHSSSNHNQPDNNNNNNNNNNNDANSTRHSDHNLPLAQPPPHRLPSHADDLSTAISRSNPDPILPICRSSLAPIPGLLYDHQRNIDHLTHHPAHRPISHHAAQLSLDGRPSISVVPDSPDPARESPPSAQTVDAEARLYDQSWPDPRERRQRLRKKGGLFSRPLRDKEKSDKSDKSTPASSPPSSSNKPARTLSVRSMNISGPIHLQQQPATRESEHISAERLDDHQQLQSGLTPRPDHVADSNRASPSSGSPLDPRPNNLSESPFGRRPHHYRTGSGESIPSQTPPPTRRPSVQPAQVTQQGEMAGGSAPATQGQGPYEVPSQGQSAQNLQETAQQNQESSSGQTSNKRQEDIENVDVAALMRKHEELQAKYTKVKRYYFEKEAQVQQLQNTVAHQRLAVSRTVLDDNEYTQRFNRLDGAINNLAFSIRKDWKSIPQWLAAYINEDAVSVGTKEMTSVGRAVISRWVVEEIFERHFHPALEAMLSVRLKEIETNLRRQQGQAFTEEDKENQIARISAWRRTTLDGLTDALQGSGAQANMTSLTDHLVEKMCAALEIDLKSPPPPELVPGARMVVENAINIAEKIPLEARDIQVSYVTPGTPVSEATMRVESGLPPLTRPAAVLPASGQAEVNAGGCGSPSGGEEMETENGIGTQTPPRDAGSGPTPKKKYGLSSFIKKGGGNNSVSSQSSSQQQSQSQSQEKQSESQRPASALDNRDKDRDQQQQNEEDKGPRVRVSMFMTVEVKTRSSNNVLVKSPVYTIE